MGFKFFHGAIAGVVLSISSVANSGIISGFHTTDEGKIVNLQGLDWLSLDHTAGFNRLDVENGFIDNFGIQRSSDKWRYATAKETEKLLFSLWDGIYDGWSNGNYDGVEWFSKNFQLLGYDLGVGNDRMSLQSDNIGFHDYTYFFYGETGACDLIESCEGHLELLQDPADAGDGWNTKTKQYEDPYSANDPVGSLTNYYGTPTGFEENFKALVLHDTPGDLARGSLIVRERTIEVPEPSTLAIFVLGMIGLASCRFKKHLPIR